MQRLLLSFVLLIGLFSFSCGEKPTRMEDFNTRVVTFPNGTKVRADVLIHPQDMARGMMFRDSLAADRGMLFLHSEVGSHPYWMYQVKIPLDIIWLDANHRIVEMSLDTPPCKAPAASQCPNFGGLQKSQFVLEVGGGIARKEGLKLGDVLEF